MIPLSAVSEQIELIVSQQQPVGILTAFHGYFEEPSEVRPLLNHHCRFCRSFFRSLWLSNNIALPKQFRKKLNYDHTAVEELLSDIAIFYRHEMMRAAARRAALFVIARYGEGDLAVFPRDLIRLIANEVWKTRLADEWLDAGQRKETPIQRRRR